MPPPSPLPWPRHRLRLVASAASRDPHHRRLLTSSPMLTAAPAAATAATAAPPSLFLRRSLSSFSSSPRHVFILPHRVAPLVVARPARLSAVPAKRGGGGVAAAASAAGSAQFGAGDSENPYEILGISPLDGFDQVKMAYKRRRKDAESNKDAEHLLKLERAYDMVMMEQLQNRKKGVAYGSIQVSKDIKYADNQPVIMYISTMGHADWKPMQFLCFAYFYRILDKLKATKPASTPIYNEYGEVEGRGIHMAKRVLRSLGLVLGSILAVSLGYTGLANFSQFLGQYIPSIVYNFQK
uniref:J domain-containing protein n=1 Tax=Oryza punctata TaxID=4537 RepID=A0A0E0M8S8_ORYPU